MVHCQHIPIIIINRLILLEIIFKIIAAIEADTIAIEKAPSFTTPIIVMVTGSKIMVIIGLAAVGVEERTGLAVFITQGMIDIIYKVT